jgi:hypothetical protein
MRGVRLGRVLLIAAVIEAIGLVANASTSFLTDKASGALRWILPPVIAIVAAMGKAAVDVSSSEPAQQSAPIPAGPAMGRAPVPYPSAPPATYGAPRPPVRRRRTPAIIAVLVLLALCGGGGFAVTGGVRFLVGWATGNESGTDRLAQQASGQGSGVTLTVRHVVYTSHYTRVDVLVQNGSQDSVSLPLFGNCVLTGSEGTTLQADPDRSRWATTIPPGASQSGTLVFGGTLPDSAQSASLSFSHVFVLGGRALTVRDIPLTRR